MKRNINYLHNPALIFLMLVLFATTIRMVALGRYETWDDEKLSVSEANGLENYNFKEGEFFSNKDIQEHNTLNNTVISTVKIEGGNGILYISLLHYWNMIFGNSDVSSRLFSVLLGVMVVIIAYVLCLEMFENKTLALFFMFLISIHPQLIVYAREARTYSLALFLVLSATLVLIKLIKNNKFSIGPLVLYSILIAVAFLAHYSTIYIFAGHLLVLFFLFHIGFKNWVRLGLSLFITLGIILLWMYGFGFEGLAVISKRNHEYMQLSANDPSNSFYMKAGLYSISAGWLQNILAFSGNGLVNFGFRIHEVLLTLIIPFLILFYGLKKTARNHFPYLRFLIALCLSSLVYATILSIIAGHIISFQTLYSIFSTPFFVLLTGIAIFQLIQSEQNKIQYVFKGLIALQIIIMLFSTTIIYFGYFSHRKGGNNYELAAENMKKMALTNEGDFVITYNKTAIALEMNKYLEGPLSGIKQIIDTSKQGPYMYLYFPKSQKTMVMISASTP